MRHMINPRQTGLFDPFRDILSPVAYRRIERGWQGVFRHVILELMPVETLAGEFSPTMGTPTKELYSMAGLLLIKEFMDWTTTRATEAYMFDASVQYALNLEPCGQSLCERTIERYEKIFIENDLAALTMDRVTTTLVKALDLDVSRQRLDSTHVFSDMAIFGRTRMMGVTIKRFLTQLKRHKRKHYDALPDALRSRYAPSPGSMFADVARNAESRRKLRQDVAEDLRFLVEQFVDNGTVNTRATYKSMVKVFGEQCEVVGDKTSVKAHPGNAITQNPSDPDANRDGHKGPGYQAQIAETCSPDNEVQLATAVIAQTAAEDDHDVTPEVLDTLEENGLLPDTLYADTHYGSDASHQQCAERGVDLQSPVAGKQTGQAVHRLTIDDFVIDEATETVERCPAGHEPVRSERDAHSGKTRTEMPAEACSTCAHFDECPVRRVRGKYLLDHTARERRLAERRREQATEAFKEHYRIRAGIESTNGGLKRRMGFGRLRCRGRPRVFHKIVMKVCGWNILRGVATETLHRRVAEIMKKLGHGSYRSPFSAFAELLGRLKRRLSAQRPLQQRNLTLAVETRLRLAA
jgi:hypothetical protein